MTLPLRGSRPRSAARGPRTPLAQHCSVPRHRRGSVARASRTDEEELAGWAEYFDSDDLALPDDAIPPELRGLVQQHPQLDTPSQAQAVTGHCYGCGLSLQTAHPDGLGYVDAELYRQKRGHRQQNELLCTRRAPQPRGSAACARRTARSSNRCMA